MSQITAFVGALLIDGQGGEPVSDSVVLVENGKFIAAGAKATVPIPEHAELVDVTGKTVMPRINRCPCPCTRGQKSEYGCGGAGSQ